MKDKELTEDEKAAEKYSQDVDLCCGTSDIIIEAEKAFLAGIEHQKSKLRGILERFGRFAANKMAEVAEVNQDGEFVFNLDRGLKNEILDEFLKSEGER